MNKWSSIFLISIVLSFCITLTNGISTVIQNNDSDDSKSQLNEGLVVLENKSIPSTEFEIRSSVQISDECFIVAGTNYSHFDDIWVAKIDFEEGIVWSYLFGGKNDEWVTDLIQTNDGGIVFTGNTDSFGAGWLDMWFVKLNSNGQVEIDRTYGGKKPDEVESVIQTSDGGFVLVGYTMSHNEEAGDDGDFWVVKTDSEGEVEWDKRYHKRDRDCCKSIVETIDGSFIIGGRTMNFGDAARQDDIWVIKIDTKGDIIWEKVIGSNDDDNLKMMFQNSKGEYYILGETESFTDIKYNTDLWLIHLDNEGNTRWNQTYGGTSPEYFRDCILTPEENLAIIADSISYSGSELSVGWLSVITPSGNLIVNKTFLRPTSWYANMTLNVFYPVGVYPANEENNLFLLGISYRVTLINNQSTEEYYLQLLKVHYTDGTQEQTSSNESRSLGLTGGYELIIVILASGLLVSYLKTHKRKK